jgi:hypothetical protein
MFVDQTYVSMLHISLKACVSIDIWKNLQCSSIFMGEYLNSFDTLWLKVCE